MKKLSYILLATLILLSPSVLSQVDSGMEKITGGTYVPLYGVDSSEIVIEDFYLDVYLITNAEYLEFVRNNPQWLKSQVKRLFAEDSYLNAWVDDTTLGKNANLKAPATTVSWYAAKAYCASENKRLPLMDEWEYVAMANENSKNAQDDSLFNQKIIEGYETPKTYANPVGSTFKNYWGIYDMHGLVWEWTSDFNSVLISGESRKDVDTDRNLFCAGGAVNATDLMDYAAFMRYAIRGSIKADYSIRNLGFRCAVSISE